MRLFALLRCALCLALLLAAPLAAAQAPVAPQASSGGAPLPASLADEQGARIEALARRTDRLEAELVESADSDEKLVDLRLRLDEVSRETIDSGVAFRPRLTQINDRLAQLGAAPAEGAPPEPQAVADERKALAAEKAGINALLGTAEQLSIRVDGLNDHIANLRRDLFAGQLTQRTPIDMALVGDVERNLLDEARSLGRTVSAWFSFVLRFKLQSMLGASFFALAVAAVLLIGGRRLFRRPLARDPTLPEPSRLDRLATAFWSTALPTLAVWVFLSVTWFLFDRFGVLRGDIGAMLASLFRVIGVVYFVHRLATTVLEPSLPNWRLLAVESRAARLLLALISTTAIFNGVDFFLASVFRLRGSALSLTVAESFAATLGTGLLVVLIGLVRPFANPDGTPRPWPPPVRIVIFALGALTIVPALFGYIGFARFVSRQIVITGAVAGLMGIGFLLARGIAEEGALSANKFGRYLRRRHGLSDATVDQVALLLSFAVNALVVLVGVPLLLLQWGFQPGDLRAWGYQFATGFQVGTFRFSPTAVVGGVLVFVLGFLVTRWFQRWLDGTVLERGRVDPGVRNSIRLVVGYAGTALAGLIAISVAGIDLSSLALVAGALSLGIGFGLQNIVSNFVSGLILLVERPFKLGDWIVAGPVSGTVRKISVRATEIETFQRQTVILPNSELINAAVGNWTHRNKLGRLDIKVNVGFGADVRHVHELLQGIARAHPLVLKNPEPQIVFVNIAATLYEMEVRVFVADVMNQVAVGNEIRFAVIETFAREGIAMISAPLAAIETQTAAPPPPVEPVAEPAPPARFRGKKAVRD